MKRIKYIIGFLLIMTGFLFTGELFIYHLDNFQESYYRTDFAFTDISEDIQDSGIINDFLDAAKKYNIDFFVVDSKIISDYKKEITIYGTDKTFNYLRSKGIIDKKYSSLFVGQTEVKYTNFANINNIKNRENWYLIGSQNKLNDMRKFKAELIDKYGGGFPKLYGSDKELLTNLLFVWGIIFILILLISLYDILYQKKEIIIKIILGENLKYIFLKNMLKDTSFFLITFLLLPELLKNLSNISFKISYISTIFVFFLLFNILISSTIFRINMKRDFANSRSSNTILIANYSLKVISSMLAILLLSTNIAIFVEGYNYYSQRTFFEEHKNYSYYQLNYKMHNNLKKSDEDTNIVQQTFYKRFQNQSLEYIDLSNNLGSKYPTILTNQTTKGEMLNYFPELNEKLKKMTSKKLYVLVPENILSDKDELIRIRDVYNFYFNGQFESNSEIITYTDSIHMIAINDFLHPYRSKMIKNPIILLNNTTQNIEGESASRQIYYAYNVMYRVSQEDIQEFIKEFQLEDQIVVQSNVLDVYSYHWTIINRSIRLVTVLSLFLLILEMMLIIFIIRLEYSVNSVEISLKKVLGYNLFRRNQKIIIVTLISSLISVLTALVLNLVVGMQEGLYLFCGGMLLFIIESIYIYMKIKFIEKANISTILKGERL